MKQARNSKLICINAGTNMREANELMNEKRIRHLPLVDDNNEIIGMLSKHDFTEVMNFQDLTVDLFASSPVKFVTESTPLSTVALKMISEKISSVILCNDQGEASGIITTDDLLYQFAQLLSDTGQHNEFNWEKFDAIQTAGAFAQKLSDIGI
ncbi:MAG: CBS domain-containing protein [Pseudobdellovibrio sp.]